MQKYIFSLLMTYAPIDDSEYVKQDSQQPLLASRATESHNNRTQGFQRLVAMIGR